MAMDYTKYPDDWKAISHRIRFERAGGKCEQCGAVHGSWIYRKLDNPAEWSLLDNEEYVYYHGHEYTDKPTLVILTVHHIGVPYPDGTPGDPRDKMDVRDENLIAMCQRCHLIADLPHHIASAKVTRAAKREQRITELGQGNFFDKA